MKWVVYQDQEICERKKKHTTGPTEMVPLDSAGAVALAMRVMRVSAADTTMRVRLFVPASAGFLIEFTNVSRYLFDGQTLFIHRFGCARLLGP